MPFYVRRQNCPNIKLNKLNKLNEGLGWETLSDRRMGRGISQIHKIMNNKTHSYLQDKLPSNPTRK